MQIDLKVLKAIPPWEWPPETRDFIFGIILDSRSSSSYLMDALELIGDPTIIDGKIAEALLRIVYNERLSSEIRGQAVISLGPVLELKDCDDSADGEELLSDEIFLNLKKSLKKLFHDSSTPEDVRRKALEASVRSTEDWHKGVLKSAFQKGGRWQLTAVFGMRWVSGCDEEILTA